MQLKKISGILQIILDNIIVNSIMYIYRVIYVLFTNKLVIGKKEGIC